MVSLTLALTLAPALTLTHTLALTLAPTLAQEGRGAAVPYLVGHGVRAIPWRSLAPLAQPLMGYTTAG
jgi:hypothetical protein